MSRQSTIKRLPSEIRQLIGELREKGKTIDEILEKLQELNVDVSRSALGRHCQSIKAISERLKESRLVAEAVVKNLGDKSDSQISRLNIEMMHSLILKVMVNKDGEGVTLDSKDAMFLATSLQKLAQASKQDLERELQIRKEITDKAAQTIEKVGKKQGISADTIEKMKKEFFGVD